MLPSTRICFYTICLLIAHHGTIRGIEVSMLVVGIHNLFTWQQLNHTHSFNTMSDKIYNTQKGIINTIVNSSSDELNKRQHSHTPLTMAALCANVEAVQALLRKGVDSTIRTAKNKTALQIAAEESMARAPGLPDNPWQQCVCLIDNYMKKEKTLIVISS